MSSDTKSWTSPAANSAEQMESQGPPLPTKYLFLSGRDKSYTGLVRAHVLERHHRRKVPIISKCTDDDNERSVVPSKRILGPAFLTRAARDGMRSGMALSPGNGVIDPFASFARRTSASEDFLADFCKTLCHRKTQVFDRWSRYWQFISAIWP